MSRAAGILLSITSLPFRYGIGCFSKSAYDFVDWLVRDSGFPGMKVLEFAFDSRDSGWL